MLLLDSIDVCLVLTWLPLFLAYKFHTTSVREKKYTRDGAPNLLGVFIV